MDKKIIFSYLNSQSIQTPVLGGNGFIGRNDFHNCVVSTIFLFKLVDCSCLHVAYQISFCCLGNVSQISVGKKQNTTFNCTMSHEPVFVTI